MNKRKLICGFCLLSIFSMCIVTFAIATAITPYRAYGCHFWDGRDDIGTVYTDRCTCNPVNNYLAARIKIQAKSGNQYYTSNWSEWVEGYNVETEYVSVTSGIGNYCNYIWGNHKARCGSGSIIALDSVLGRPAP